MLKGGAWWPRERCWALLEWMWKWGGDDEGTGSSLVRMLGVANATWVVLVVVGVNIKTELRVSVGLVGAPWCSFRPWVVGFWHEGFDLDYFERGQCQESLQHMWKIY